MFYAKNISDVQGVVRIALALVGLGFMLAGMVKGVALLLGGVAVVSLALSGIIGFCPMCAMLKLGRRHDNP